MIHLSNKQARQFILLKQGLLGNYKFQGKAGALAYIRQAGCIQFDPVDICGKNAELTLQSRVRGFSKRMLYQLLYEDRKLFDFPDKNLSIVPMEDWPYFSRFREIAKRGGKRFDGITELEMEAKEYISKHGAVSSDELPIAGNIHWHSHIHWSGNWHGDTNAARAVLEQLYSVGDLIIHHKRGTRKYYDLAERHISKDVLSAQDPLGDEHSHQKWRVLRRIEAVGLLWNKTSDAYLGIQDMKSIQRNAVFRELLNEGSILEVKVDGMQDLLYCRKEDQNILDTIKKDGTYRSRCEFIAPLDCMLWDRKLIRAIFGFDYTWEIYTPSEKRKYGYYTLPVLLGDRFIGRIEMAAEGKTKTLHVKNIWYEDGVRTTKKLEERLERRIKRFAAFNHCVTIADYR